MGIEHIINDNIVGNGSIVPDSIKGNNISNVSKIITRRNSSRRNSDRKKPGSCVK